MKIRKSFLLKTLILPLLVSSFFLIGFQQGMSAKGYRYMKLREFNKAIEVFSMANDKKGIGLVHIKQKFYK